MKKRILLILAFAIFAMAIVACENKENGRSSLLNNKEKLKVVTSIFPQYDFTREIVGDKVDLEMLIKPGSDIHYFEPSPQDIIKIQEADLFIYTGGHEEEWIEKALLEMKDKPVVIRLMDLVDLYDEEIVEGMEHVHDHEGDQDHDHGDKHDHVHEEDYEGNHDHPADYDEHVWTSLRNAQIIVASIEKQISSLDKPNEDYYSKNSQDYIEKLKDLDERFIELFESKEDEILIFGDRFPFRYFVEDYDLKYFAAFPGCSSDVEPSPKTLSFLIDKSEKLGIDTIYHIESSNGEMARSIAESVGGKTKMLHSCHNLSNEEFEKGVSYLELMEVNLKTLGGK